MQYELIKDFLYTDSTSKKIMTISKGTKLDSSDDFFVLKVKSKPYKLDKNIVEANPDFFKKIDMFIELTEILRKNKKMTAPRLAKLIDEFYQQNVLKDYHPILSDYSNSFSK